MSDSADMTPHMHPTGQPGTGSTSAADEHLRFVWGVAGQLAAGLLANPGKQHFSVKDSISLFDEVLHELEAYARVRGDFSEWVNNHVSETEERREVQRAVTLGTEGAAPRVSTPVPGAAAAAAAGAEDTTPTPLQQPAPAPMPIRPHIGGGIQMPDLPLPPADAQSG